MERRFCLHQMEYELSASKLGQATESFGWNPVKIVIGNLAYNQIHSLLPIESSHALNSKWPGRT